MPGTIALLKVKDNSSSVESELSVISQTFLNSANPAVDPMRYISVIEEKLREYASYSCTQKRLVINTCGWVEGPGAEIQERIVVLVQDILQGQTQAI